MRKVVAASALLVVAVSVSLVACDRTEAPSQSTSADVERDLNLASSVQSQRTGIVSPVEQISNGAPSGDNAGKRIAVPTTKRSPSPAPSPTVAEVATAPADANKESAAQSTSATETALVSAAAGGGEVPTVMVTDPIRSTTLSVAALGATDHMDLGNDGRRPSRPGLNTVRGILARWSQRPGVVIRGGSTGRDHCDAPAFGGGGILGGTFGGSGSAHSPYGTSSGGVGTTAPDFLPAGIDPLHRGGPPVAAGADNKHFGGKGG
ncbi:MAG: hypothetical protein ABJB66_12670 [Gemmatimonadaceae bacterium]